MTKDQLVVGNTYRVKHTSGYINAKLLAIRTTSTSDWVGSRRGTTRYLCLNLNTGREVTIKSALRFKQ